MKKHLSKIVLTGFIALSIFCLGRLNSIESSQTQQEINYEQLSETKDKMVTGFKSATVIVGKVVDYLTKRDIG